MPLSPEDKKNLVKLARNSISLYFKNQETEKPHFIERFGVFVNIEKNNKLRGSIGFPDPIMSLAQAVSDGARCAAFLDPKFPPLKENELNEVTFQVSFLTKSRPIKELKEIDIKKHGIVVEYMGYKGMILPHELPKDSTLESTLSLVCEKADLPSDFWKEPCVKISIFETEVYKEVAPNADVVEIKISN